MHKLYLLTMPIQCSILTLSRSSKSTKRYHISNRSTKNQNLSKLNPIKQTEPARRTIKSQATHSNQATLSPFNPKHKCTAIFKTHSQNLKTLQTKAQKLHEAPPHQLFKLSITPKPIFAPIRGNCESIPQETYSRCGNCK